VLGCGEVPERPKGVDCKSIGYAFAGSNPALATIFRLLRDEWQVILLKVAKLSKKIDNLKRLRKANVFSSRVFVALQKLYAKEN
jgi:hypothetical protein